jgi:uncharacterized membrane protein required for colicin V production
MAEDISAGFFDRILGAIFGALRGILLSMMIFLGNYFHWKNIC